MTVSSTVQAHCGFQVPRHGLSYRGLTWFVAGTVAATETRPFSATLLGTGLPVIPPKCDLAYGFQTCDQPEPNAFVLEPMVLIGVGFSGVPAVRVFAAYQLDPWANGIARLVGKRAGGWCGLK